ncbi:unnamed protein product [Calypogeia fissa]
MSMAAWQCLAARLTQRSARFSQALRAHHSLSWSPQCQSSMGAMDPNLFPRVAYPGEHVPYDNAAAIRIPFMQLMAVPKRKVSPSRRGKRNGPKALKPVPVVAQCKVCGRIKLPHFYCCSGEAKEVEGIQNSPA